MKPVAAPGEGAYCYESSVKACVARHFRLHASSPLLRQDKPDFGETSRARRNCCADERRAGDEKLSQNPILYASSRRESAHLFFEFRMRFDRAHPALRDCYSFETVSDGPALPRFVPVVIEKWYEMAQAFAKHGVIIHNENPALDGRADISI
jgi:hypothetical protein